MTKFKKMKSKTGISMKNILAGVALVVTASLSDAAMLDKETAQLSKCSGFITANSYIDYTIGKITREEFLEVLKISNSLLLDKLINQQGLSRELVVQYDSINKAAFEQLTISANNNNFGTAEYEEVIACYIKYSSIFLQKSSLDKNIRKIVEDKSREDLHNIDIVLDK